MYDKACQGALGALLASLSAHVAQQQLQHLYHIAVRYVEVQFFSLAPRRKTELFYSFSSSGRRGEFESVIICGGGGFQG